MVLGGSTLCFFKEPLGNLWFAGMALVFSSPPLFLAAVLPLYRRTVLGLASFAFAALLILFFLLCALVFILRSWKATTAAAYFGFAALAVLLADVRTG